MHNSAHYERQYLRNTFHRHQFWRVAWPSDRLRHRWLPPRAALDRAGHPGGPGPSPSRHQPPCDAAPGTRPGGNPLGCLRGRDDRHSDWPADPQHRPAKQGLRQHCAEFSPRACGLCLLVQVRRARSARRRALVGPPDGPHRGGRRGGQEVAEAEVRHRIPRLHDPDRRAAHRLRKLGACAAQPLLCARGRCAGVRGLHGCAAQVRRQLRRPHPRAGHGHARGPGPAAVRPAGCRHRLRHDGAECRQGGGDRCRLRQRRPARHHAR